MSRLRKLGLGIIIGLVIILLLAYWYVRYLETKGIPNYGGEVELKGLTNEVKVYRDKYAIPHIFAKNEPDLYRAVGYCVAQDRLFQMDLIRRLTSGRLSEVIGEETIDVDHLMRALRIPEKSRKIYEMTDKCILQLTEAFCDGVNQYIDSNKDRLPIEFTILGYDPEKWEPEHAFNVVGYFSFDLSTSWDSEVFFQKVLQKVDKERVREILPDLPAKKEMNYPHFSKKIAELDLLESLASVSQMLKDMGLTVFYGSNNWAVSGRKSVTGKPILANDMHLGLNAPGIWYQMHQVIEGKFSVTGVLAPGQPFIIAGHNGHIAWGFTNVMVDDMDFYLEKINPDNPNEYQYNGQWQKLEVRKEKIKIKGGRVIEKEIRFTHRGPIISEFKEVKDKAISMRWIGNEDSNEARTMYLLNKAEDWDEFKNALRTLKSVCQNTIYADTAGNIGLFCAAGVPIRKKGYGISIMPGWTDEYDWKGFVPFEELPHSFNPDNGFLASANNKTVGNDYPYYITTWFTPEYRFRRINEMLKEKKNISIEDFKHMHADVKSKLVENMRGDLIDSIKNIGDLDALEKHCFEMLKIWDGIISKESTAATIFEVFYIKFVRNLFADELGDGLFKRFLSMTYIVSHSVDQLWEHKSSGWYDNVTTADREETFNDIVQKSYRESVRWLKEELGENPEKWEWGEIHQLTLKHPLGTVKALDWLFSLNRGPYPVGGAFHTVCPFKYKLSDPFHVIHGASHRHIYSLANWDESFSVIPTGNAGVPSSRHYCDQTALYISDEYHPDYVSRPLIEKNAVYVMTLRGK